jgi:hypothetical protein
MECTKTLYEEINLNNKDKLKIQLSKEDAEKKNLRIAIYNSLIPGDVIRCQYMVIEHKNNIVKDDGERYRYCIYVEKDLVIDKQLADNIYDKAISLQINRNTIGNILYTDKLVKVISDQAKRLTSKVQGYNCTAFQKITVDKFVDKVGHIPEEEFKMLLSQVLTKKSQQDDLKNNQNSFFRYVSSKLRENYNKTIVRTSVYNIDDDFRLKVVIQGDAGWNAYYIDVKILERNEEPIILNGMWNLPGDFLVLQDASGNESYIYDGELEPREGDNGIGLDKELSSFIMKCVKDAMFKFEDELSKNNVIHLGTE